MPNQSGRFRADPLGYLKRMPIACYAADFIGVQKKKMKVEKMEDYEFAELQNAGSDEDGIDFYVLGWKSEQVSVGKLGSDASFFYTGPMTGCTFAVDKNWYTPQVIHVNKNDPESQSMDVKGMNTMVSQGMAKCWSWFQRGYAPNITIVRSDNRGSLSYNIFGWRGKGGWTFYQQVIDNVGVGEMTVKNLLTLSTWF